MVKMVLVSIAALSALTFGCAAPVETGDPSLDPAAQESVGTQQSAMESDSNNGRDDDDSNPGRGCEKGHKGKDDHADKCGGGGPVF